MLRSTTSKVMWVGRATVFLVGLAVILALVFGVATTALAGTGVGDVFNLGKTNTVDAMSKLVGSTTGSTLMVANKQFGGTALDLRVDYKGFPPMKVDSQAKVENLNADQLDGRDSSVFVRAWGTGFLREQAKSITPGFVGMGLGQFESKSPNVTVYYFCPSNLSNNGTLSIENSANETINVFSDNGLDKPNAYRQLSKGQSFDQEAAAIGEHITLQAAGTGVATIEVFSVHRTSSLGTGTENDCHVQAVGLWANSPS